jgi:hypothetical protein
MKRFTVSFTLELEDTLPTGESIDYNSKFFREFVTDAFVGSLTENESIQDFTVLET